MRNEPEDFETSDMIAKMLYIGEHFRYGDVEYDSKKDETMDTRI